MPVKFVWQAVLTALLLWAAPVQAGPRCLSECTQRLGIVSAFGAEADLLLAQAQGKRVWQINGNRYTTGVLRGSPVVIVLSGVSMINATLATQLMLDHFNIERLIMSGIAGGTDPGAELGDVAVPQDWAMPMEVYWNGDGQLPAPCGAQSDVSCLGLRLATGADGRPLPDFRLRTPQGEVATGLFMRENFVLNADTAPGGEYRLRYPVDARMLAVARSLRPPLARCGPRGGQCVSHTPQLRVGGTGVSGTAFLAHPQYRDYLHTQLDARVVDMETAAVAHVAHANRVPYIGFRSVSDLAGASPNHEVGVFFQSGLAEHNAAAVTLAFLEAWRARQR